MSSLASTALPLIEDTANLLKTRQFGRAMHGYTAAPSTNTLAMTWATEGAQEGSVVVAEFQTAGRGRHGRTWDAAAGLNLTFSVILRPALPPAHLSLVTLASSVAVREAIAQAVAPLQPVIKWPNDILLEGRKCCGMLLESTLTESGAATVILGIGLNVNQSEFPDALAPLATSLLLATGRPVPRPALFAKVLLQLERQYALLHRDADAVRHAYEQHLQGLGQPISLRLTDHGQVVDGLFEGITETGALRLQTDQGVRIFHAGEVAGKRLQG